MESKVVMSNVNEKPLNKLNLVEKLCEVLKNYDGKSNYIESYMKHITKYDICDICNEFASEAHNHDKMLDKEINKQKNSIVCILCGCIGYNPTRYHYTNCTTCLNVYNCYNQHFVCKICYTKAHIHKNNYNYYYNNQDNIYSYIDSDIDDNDIDDFDVYDF